MQLHYQCLSSLVIFLVLNLSDDSAGTPQGHYIQRWAKQLGNELWNLGKVITNRRDFEIRYKSVELETKDPRKIIEEIVGNVSYMMKKKMDAVCCIINTAEAAAKEFDLNASDRDYQYYRSNPPVIYKSEADPTNATFLNMTVNNDTHFFNLAVNRNHSSVHVPMNVYDKHDEPETAIKWSEELDDVFVKNYNADPALSWQYFGSSSGIMRHYPDLQHVQEIMLYSNCPSHSHINAALIGNELEIACTVPHRTNVTPCARLQIDLAMEWGPKDRGLFDCRIRTWFIEAATCTKDVVILLDSSGSMTGMNKHIASLVVNTILDTLSNNDYINVMNYSEGINYTVPCFNNTMIQATEENIIVFKNAIQRIIPENKSQVDVALTEAFKLLNKYRDIRKCNKTNTSKCNQAIMIVSDGISTNVSDVMSEYNRIENRTSSPIRIFTFLVGKEATHLSESQWIACNNRGYHSHVDALEQVTAAVYQYVLVFARPLVLHAKNPLSWTHAYYDDTFDFENKTGRSFEKYRLLTTVAGPVLDLKEQEDTSISAKLLGVAGTDVPVAEIAKLMYPHKTGVNSHSFIVSNNGYVLKHPDLRPMFEDNLKDNYNSIDVTEVEQVDDLLGPRELNGSILLKLRDALVDGDVGVIHDIPIKYHYDDMRRVSREINDYHYAPINGTPFSIGFAIPDLYGNYSIKVGDEIELHRFSTINISTFFSGSNWKIHPKWVYCKFHYLEGHEFENPEKELLAFINRMNTDSFKWSLQYEKDDEDEDEEQQKQKEEKKDHCRNVVCGARTLSADAYYCDRNLVQRLVFDAKLTKPAFDVPWAAQSPAEDYWRLLYNATSRFVATMSGLTRWEYISIKVNDSDSFGARHPRAIDETWYKSAVIQNRHNKESFVYAVPFDSQEQDDLLVTGSYAIFPTWTVNGTTIAAPAAVVGFQFSHSHLTSRFFNITSSAHTCSECHSCASGLDCYVVDSSGYIIISKDKEQTGIFFGEVDGGIMEAMIKEGIFKNITLRDYQALCYYQAWVKGDGNILTTPFYYLIWVIKWIFSQIVLVIIKTSSYQIWYPSWIEAVKLQIHASDNPQSLPKCNKKCNEEEEAWHEKNKIPTYSRRHTACEKEHDLYILQQDKFSPINPYLDGIPATQCNRKFYITMIPRSNLLFIAINTIEESSSLCHYIHNTRLRDIVYETHTNFPCQKLYLNDLKRRPLQDCYNEHDRESEIKMCGKSNRITFSVNHIIVSILIVIQM